MFGFPMRISAFLMVALSVLPAMAGQAHMATGILTSQPIGHYEFCQELPYECRQTARQNILPTVLTQAVWTQIVSVNTRANTLFAPRSDLAIYGQDEVWAYPTDFADCEDYVLIKRFWLQEELDIPLSNLLITVVKQPNGEGHAVLTLRTDRGDFILDNLTDEVKRWDATDYTFIKRQSARHAGHWVALL